MTKAATPNAAGGDVQFYRTDGSGTNYLIERYRYTGTQTVETAIVRTGGATDGSKSASRKIVTTANARWILPFTMLPCPIWNPTVGANVGVTIYGLYNGPSLPNNDDFWLDVEYLGNASTTLGSVATSTKSNLLATGSATTADTSAWDSLATARQNTHAYSVGDAIAVSDNSGRVFFCTTAGTSASSEPAGYASAIDGDSVTDNSAVFRAGVRFKQTVTLSTPQPAQTGLIFVEPRIATASATYYIDPQPVLS